jgi:hypothetical protein
MFTDEWTSGYREQIRRRLAPDFTDWKDDQKFQEHVKHVIQPLRADRGGRATTAAIKTVNGIWR